MKIVDPMAPPPEGWTAEYVEMASAYARPIPLSGVPRFALVGFEDDRPDVTSVGLQRDTWGRELGTVELDEGDDLEDVFVAHLVSCFRAAGYDLVSSHSGILDDRAATQDVVALVEVELDSFWTDFAPGFFSVEAKSDVRFEIKLLSPDDRAELYRGRFQGEGEVGSGFGVTRAMFEESLNQAHSQAMHALLDALRGEVQERIVAKAAS